MAVAWPTVATAAVWPTVWPKYLVSLRRHTLRLLAGCTNASSHSAGPSRLSLDPRLYPRDQSQAGRRANPARPSDRTNTTRPTRSVSRDIYTNTNNNKIIKPCSRLSTVLG